jgi:dihydrofolate synthase / folylpolyglutamate synthase
MDYQQTIDYLYSRLPMFSRTGADAIKTGLDNIISLCDGLGNPHHAFKSVHVAGTNGKGSVSHMLAAILQHSGYKVGLYTSPHLKDFRERIRVNGEMISQSFVTGFTEKIKPRIEAIAPSFFEITVAMAFDYFKREQVDIAIIEVGLGGRLDSTNIITPELSVITNIGLDHMQLLGNTLEAIAFEKAGIIKKDAPVVIGEMLPETAPVFEKVARENNAELSVASLKRRAIDWRWEKAELVIEVADQQLADHDTYHLDLPGLYQKKNLLTVLEACTQLRKKGWNISEMDIHQALREVKKATGLHGRWEIIHSDPIVILDVAHNTDGIRQLVQQLELTSYRHLHIVFGMVKDKDIADVLSLLPRHANYYFTRAQIPRAIPETELLADAANAGLKGTAHPIVNSAIRNALQNAEPTDLILVCGSVFLIGEVNTSIHPVSASRT